MIIIIVIFPDIIMAISQKLYPLKRFGMTVVAIAISSCASSPPSASNGAALNSPSPVEETKKIQIVTTILPITEFTHAVVGDQAEVTQLLPANVSPHDYQAQPADVQAIATADILVKNGLELESYLDNLIKNAENPDLVIIDSSQGITPIAYAKEDEHEHEHEHDNHHHHGDFDPHIWLDPKRAITQIENIRDGLIAADPTGKEQYTANATAFIEQLKTLDREITQALQPYAGKTFITFHDFAQYFAESYGLNAHFLVNIPEENPSPENMRHLTEIVKAENIRAILREPQAGEKVFETLAKDLQIQVSIFDPMDTGATPTPQAPTYLTIMRQNTDNLVEALSQ